MEERDTRNTLEAKFRVQSTKLCFSAALTNYIDKTEESVSVQLK